MTASAPIAGTLRAIPDAAPALPQDSGVPAHANFRSVLEQFRAPRESDAKSDDDQSGPQQKQKDSDPTTTLAPPQQVTPLAADAPRLILPFNTSITLRRDPAAAPDEATASTENTATTPDPTAAANPNPITSVIATTSPTPVIFRSTLDLPGLPLGSDPKTNSAPSGARQKLLAKLQAKWQATSKDSVPAPASTTPADPSAPVLPVTSSTTVQQATTVVKVSSTVDEAPATASSSTSTLDLGASIHTTSRNAAAQYRLSQESDSTTAARLSAQQQQQQQQPKVSDSTATIPVPVPLPATETADPQRPLHPLAASNTPRQDAPAVPSSSPATQDPSASSGTDSKTAISPAIEQANDTTAAPPAGSLAFAARLTPTEETPASTSIPAPDAARTTDPQSRVPSALQSATPSTARQIASETDLPADAHSGDGGSQAEKENRFAKPEMVLPQTHATFQDQAAAATASHASATPLSPAARMDQVQEPAATKPNGNHDITIRIPDSATDQGTAVRFVERAGEVHVSVRTGDAEMAQTLRGGLYDLVGRLEDSGIRTQVWQPGADSSASQNDSQQPFADPDGSNGRQFSSGSNSEQESKQQNKPRWVEELESSIGNPNFKETTQLPWQA